MEDIPLLMSSSLFQIVSHAIILPVYVSCIPIRLSFTKGMIDNVTSVLGDVSITTSERQQARLIDGWCHSEISYTKQKAVI